MKVLLALLLDKDKGKMFYMESYDIFMCIAFFFFLVRKKQNFERLPDSAQKGIQKSVDFKWIEKWFKCTELFTASGFYFLCELYLSRDFIIVHVVHAAIVKIVGLITNPLFQMGFITQL